MHVRYKMPKLIEGTHGIRYHTEATASCAGQIKHTQLILRTGHKLVPRVLIKPHSLHVNDNL